MKKLVFAAVLLTSTGFAQACDCPDLDAMLRRSPYVGVGTMHRGASKHGWKFSEIKPIRGVAPEKEMRDELADTMCKLEYSGEELVLLVSSPSGRAVSSCTTWVVWDAETDLRAELDMIKQVIENGGDEPIGPKLRRALESRQSDTP